MPSIKPKSAIGLELLVPSVLIMVGGYLAGTAWLMKSRADEILEWPTVAATIDGAEYVYEVDGKTYRGKMRSEPETLVVHRHPEKPEISIHNPVARELGFEFWAGIVFAVLGTIFGVVVLARPNRKT